MPPRFLALPDRQPPPGQPTRRSRTSPTPPAPSTSRPASRRSPVAQQGGPLVRSGDGPRPPGGERQGARAGEEAARHAEANPTSASLTKQADATRERLGHLSGAAFDRAYIDNEVAYHKTVNGALETTLIPNAKNGELKSLLETGLTLFREHQAHAEQVAKELK